MISDARHFLKPELIEADICIIGGGVAGIVLAKELEAKFDSIVVLESGEEKFSQKNQNLNSANSVKTHYFNPMESRLRMLGGASNHWENNTAEFLPSDFVKKNWIENSGWPISYDDLADYYIRAGIYCGVGDDGYDVQEWTNRLGGTNDFEDSSSIELGFSKHATPPTRFFAKFNQYLEASTKIRIIKSANALGLDYDKETKKVSSVKFKRIHGEHEHQVKAKTFVLACGGIENARLMLYFNKPYDNQLGNKHANVGAFFMDHPTMRPAQFYPSKNFEFDRFEKSEGDRHIYNFFKISDSAVEENKISNMKISFFEASNYFLSHGISSMHILKEGFSKSTIPEDPFDHLGNIVGDIDMIFEAYSRKSRGKKFFDSGDESGGFFVHLMMEQTPSRNNRVSLSNKVDALGIPKVDIDWQFTQKDKDSLWKGLELLAKEVGRLGMGRIRLLKERESRLFGNQMGFGHHHMGTTRMAERYEDGVVDSNQKVFGTSNFFIAGSSVFPTGSHVPPTLTIVATSIRLAEHLKKMESL